MTRRWPGALGRAALLAGALVLLTSAGGAAIYAAPGILPGLYFAGRSSRSRSHRAAAAVVAALTVASLAWFGTYTWVGETTPLIWALPLTSGLITLGMFVANYARWQPA